MGCKTLREGSQSLFSPPSLTSFLYAEKDSALVAKWRHFAYSVPSPSHRCIFSAAIPSLHILCHPIFAIPLLLFLPSHCCIFFAIPLLHILRHPIVAYSSPSHCCIFSAIPLLHILCHPIVAYLVLPSHRCIFSAAIPSLHI